MSDIDIKEYEDKVLIAVGEATKKSFNLFFEYSEKITNDREKQFEIMMKMLTTLISLFLTSKGETNSKDTLNNFNWFIEDLTRTKDLVVSMMEKNNK